MPQEQEKILVVDDEAAIRKLLCQKLAVTGYSCSEAADAEQAIKQLEGTTFELVILDIKMPGKSGVELLPVIKAGYADTAVIMATANTDTTVAINCIKQGAYDYLTKPFNLDNVILSVARALEKRSLEIENREYQKNLEDKVAEQATRIRSLFFNAITALAYALEAKDRYTRGHSERVSEIAVAIGRELGLPGDIIGKLRLAGLVHDIGKIGVEEDILSKPARLTVAEFHRIQTHPEVGERILTPIADDDMLRWIRSHHERYDGTGYPDRLKDSQIPLGARILAVSDAFEAMTSERPYRKAMQMTAALSELEHYRGLQYDPEVVTAFLRSSAVQSTGSSQPARWEKE
ncbi:MAG: HD domain-containing phosphohydrolase [Chloroflexota bacterium]